jgi:pilus assembly protein CpaB
MNNTVLKIIAVVLAIGAVLVAIMGVRLSRQPAATPAVQVAAPASVPTESVAVAARVIKAGRALGPADLQMKGVPNPPVQAYRQIQDLIGKVPLADIQPGTTLLPTQLMTDSMAALVRPGERAVAILVDEIIGLGGFAKPGDHVDVLSYVPANRDTKTIAFAQVAVHDARVISFGDATQLDTDRDRGAAASSPEAAAKSGLKTGQELKDLRSALHSAVIAISEADVTRLMLASSSGVLRLALRPQTWVSPDPLSVYPKGNRAEASTPSYTVTTADLAPPSAREPNSNAPDADGVVIQEGSKERRLTKNP